jgi:hypothetical protein
MIEQAQGAQYDEERAKEYAAIEPSTTLAAATPSPTMTLLSTARGIASMASAPCNAWLLLGCRKAR